MGIVHIVWDNQSGSLKRLPNTNWSDRLNSDSPVVKTKSKLNIIRIYALTHKHWLVGRPASSLKKLGAVSIQSELCGFYKDMIRVSSIDRIPE